MLNLNYRSVNLPIILFIILKGLLPPTVHFHHLGYLFHLHPHQYYTNWPSPVTNVTPVTQDQFKASMQLRNMSYYTCNTTSSAKCPPIRTTVIFIFKSQLCLIIVNLSVTHKMLRERVLVGGISTRHMRGKNFRSLVRYLKDKLMQQRQKNFHIALSLGSPGKDRRRGRLPIKVWSRDLLLQTLSTLSHSVAI